MGDSCTTPPLTAASLLTAPIMHCYVFAPRYSASLLTDLYSRHQQSLWAHSGARRRSLRST